MLKTEERDKLCSIKNVECPYCGYLLPMLYNKDTNVNNLLITCKGRQCKKSFVLNIKHGIQKNNIIDIEDVDAFQKVFGSDYREHLHDKYGDAIEVFDSNTDISYTLKRTYVSVGSKSKYVYDKSVFDDFVD